MDDKKRLVEFGFNHIKKTSWLVIALAVLVDAMILVLSMQVVLPWMRSSFPVETFTNGLIQATLLFSLARFVLAHIPNRIANGYSPQSMLLNLAITWVWGILFAVLYVRTENLFAVIGVHALANAPVTLMAMPSEGVAGLLPLVLSLVLIFVWRPAKRWLERLGRRSEQSGKTLAQERAA